MVFTKVKWLTLTVALCFAILQALQPFIHAHIGTNHPAEHTGLHVGNDHEEIWQVDHAQSNHYTHAVPYASDIVSVESGIKKDSDLMLALDVVGTLLFSLCLAVALLLTIQQFYQSVSSPYHSLKRRLPASRAPPQH